MPILHIWVKALAERNVKLTVFAIHYPYRNEEYSWNGITIVPLNIANNRIKRNFAFGKLKKKFLEKNKTKKFDIVQSFWFNEATYFGLKLSKELSIPIVATAVGQDVLLKNKWLRKIDFCEIDKLLLISKFHDSQWTRKPNLSVEIIPFGINEEEMILYKKSIDIVGVGNLIPLKQFDYLVRMVAEMVVELPNVRVEIIGIGPEIDRLQKQIEKSNLTKNIKLIGGLNYENTMERIASAKLLIHPSSYESFGMIFVEALALKTKVLAAPVGLAFEEAQIEKLTFDPKSDAKNAIDLLNDSIPNRKIYNVESTVDEYMKIYNRF